MRIIYVAKPSTTSDASTTLQTTQSTTEQSTTEQSTTETTSTTTIASTTTTVSTTTVTTTPEVTTVSTTDMWATTPSLLVCPEGLTIYLPVPAPENCTRYYYCSRGVFKYILDCQRGLFFTPGNDRCTTDVPDGCEHLVE